jgi:hypothetical protein
MKALFALFLTSRGIDHEQIDPPISFSDLVSRIRPTQHAPDWWESPRFQTGASAQAGSVKAAFSRLAYQGVTLTFNGPGFSECENNNEVCKHKTVVLYRWLPVYGCNSRCFTRIAGCLAYQWDRSEPPLHRNLRRDYFFAAV